MLPKDLFRHVLGVARAITLPSDRAIFMAGMDDMDTSPEQRAEIIEAVDNSHS
jgi:hypothetical protein